MNAPFTNIWKPVTKITASTYLWPLVMIGLGVFNLWTRRHTTWTLAWNIPFIVFGALCIPLFATAQLGRRRISQKLVRMENAMYKGPYQSRDATQDDFLGLDLSLYDSSVAEFAAWGFRFLHDDVNLTVALPGKKPTVLRRFLGDAGATMANIASLRNKRQKRYVECESELSDGAFISTSNAGDVLRTNPYPFIYEARLPQSASVAEVIHRHREQVQSVLIGRPGTSLRRFSTLADVHGAQQRMRARVVEFRQSPYFDWRSNTVANYGKPVDDFKAAVLDDAATLLAADRRPPTSP